jgi:hypothetical protein
MIIAVDFDGTLVDHEYPRIGREKMFAFETLKLLLKEQHRLILWTIRTGKELDEAIEFCRERGVEFYAANKNFPEEVFDEVCISRKVNADIFIDDRNLGGFPGWSEIYQMLCDTGALPKAADYAVKESELSGRSFLAKFFKKSRI